MEVSNGDSRWEMHDIHLSPRDVPPGKHSSVERDLSRESLGVGYQVPQDEV